MNTGNVAAYQQYLGVASPRAPAIAPLDPLTTSFYPPAMIHCMKEQGERQAKLRGRIPIPASKSHTIRALLIATFARGSSRLRRPLVSLDTNNCRAVVEKFGAEIEVDGEDWVLHGIGGRVEASEHPVLDMDVGNSGTTLYFATALAALSGCRVRFDGDKQIRRRSAASLLSALAALGARIEGAKDGCAPFTICGPLKPGIITVDCPTSQFLSALILAAPLISSSYRDKGLSAGERMTTETNISGSKKTDEYCQKAEATQIEVRSLNEAPYVDITLDWLSSQNITYKRDGWRRFSIPSGQSYRAFDRIIPADWSSAAFFLAAAAITGSEVILEGLDLGDSQGDKAVVDMLRTMGCRIDELAGGIRVVGKPLRGGTFNLNATPDALPAMAVIGCYASGTTRLVNVPQARIKETDRIAVMCAELGILGANIEELPDGLVIKGGLGMGDSITGSQGSTEREPVRIRPDAAVKHSRATDCITVDGHGDHRVVMALAVAALGIRKTVCIQGAEVIEVTFPGFFDLLDHALGRD